MLPFSREWFLLTLVSVAQLGESQLTNTLAPNPTIAPDTTVLPVTTVQPTTTLLPAPSISSSSTLPLVLQTTGVRPGIAVKPGTELRILPVGDSLTVGYESSDKNGYRAGLLQDLSGVYIKS